MRLLSLCMYLECAELTEQREEQILNCNMPDLEDVTYENQLEEAVAMIEESLVGAEITINQPSKISMSLLEDAYGV